MRTVGCPWKTPGSLHCFFFETWCRLQEHHCQIEVNKEFCSPLWTDFMEWTILNTVVPQKEWCNISHVPGDSSRDLVISDRWRALNLERIQWTIPTKVTSAELPGHDFRNVQISHLFFPITYLNKSSRCGKETLFWSRKSKGRKGAKFLPKEIAGLIVLGLLTTIIPLSIPSKQASRFCGFYAGTLRFAWLKKITSCKLILQNY